MSSIRPLLLLPACIALVAQDCGLKEAKQAFEKGNYTSARPCLEFMANRDNAEAQYLLFLMYIDGKGVPYDPILATHWLQLAADHGHTTAQREMGLVYVRGGKKPEFVQVGAQWLRKAADKGDAKALETLLALYFTERLPPDPPDKAKWVHLAAEQGDPDMQDSYGLLCLRGDGVTKSRREALNWFRKAALQGHGISQMRLAGLYSIGKDDIPADLVEAYAWCLLSHESGDDRKPLVPEKFEQTLSEPQITAGRERAAALKAQITEAKAKKEAKP